MQSSSAPSPPDPQQQHKQQQQHEQQQQQERRRGSNDSSWHVTDVEKAACILSKATRVLLVPGYGVAASRCQSELCEFAKILLSNCAAEFAVSPIAGRLPGHISLFLQDVPQHFLKTGRQVNDKIVRYDACVVIGANDVVNPLLDKSKTLAKGMIVAVWCIPKVIVLRRSKGPRGAQGAPENPLFGFPNVAVLPGDAKSSLSSLNNCMRRLGLSLPDGRAWPALRVEEELGENSPRRPWPQPVKTVGVLKETVGSTIGCLDPSSVSRLRRMGFAVLMETNCSSYEDAELTRAGAKICGLNEILAKSDVLLHPSIPPLDYFVAQETQRETAKKTVKSETSQETAAKPGDGRLLICFHPVSRPSALLEFLAGDGWTVLTLDVSSPSLQGKGIAAKAALESLRGYKAMIEAFFALPKLVKGLITAAGKIEPAIVLVLGAGVAGLHAAAVAYRAGAKVFAADPLASTRPLVESVGAVFLSALTVLPSWASLQDFPKVVSGLRLLVEKSDIVICAPGDAAGGPPPQLIPKEWLACMRPGSVIVDLASGHPEAAKGWHGSVEGAPVLEGAPMQQGPPTGVTLLSGSALEQTMPQQATRMLGETFCNLLEELQKVSPCLLPGETDAVLRSLVIVKDGHLVSPASYALFRGKRTLSNVNLYAAKSNSPKGFLPEIGSAFFGG